MSDNFCMLAPQMPQGFSHYDVLYPVYVQPKLDGIRCLIIDGVPYSRNMKPIRNKAVQLVCSKLPRFVRDYVIDGEWYAHGLNFNEIQGVIMDEEDDLTIDFHFVAWDAIDANTWHKRAATPAYAERLLSTHGIVERLHRDCHVAVSSYFQLIPTKFIGNPLMASRYYSDLLTSGYEGVMFKSLTGLYKWGRCTVRENIMLKYKPIFDLDTKIVRVEEGTGKWTDALGAIFINIAGKEVSTGPGRGVTEAYQRKLWKMRGKLPGRTVELYHSGMTADGSLRFPKFKTVRRDK